MRKKRSPAQLRTVICGICGASFQTRHSQGKYCSEACIRKGCQASWNAYTRRNKGMRLEGSKQHYRKNREAVIARTNAYRITPAGKSAVRSAYVHQKVQHPDRVAARQAVSIATRSGALVKKPCEMCGTRKVHAHHPDYSRPLDVVWLCPPCHRKEHLVMKNAQIIAESQLKSSENVA